MIEARFVLAVSALGALAIGLAATLAVPVHPLLVWNASASAPIGLYAVAAPDELEARDMVIARAPERFRMLAARRRYLPANVPLVKRVAARPGDTVCASGPTIFVNRRVVARRMARDGFGRAMPWWTGCVTLRRGALFLLMDDAKSFDGRYFGPTDARDIVGKATLLWAR
jgi:conjugative transfer signal peptidase TraF